MPKQNAYLAKLAERSQRDFDAGFDTGFQQCWDMFCIALTRKHVVGAVPFAMKQIARVYAEILKMRNEEFTKAFEPFTAEADYQQEQMDEALRVIWKDKLEPFAKRYPYIRQCQYSKAYKE